MDDRSGQQSPRLRLLWKELEASPENGDAVVEKFLSERRAAQGPLVEPLPGSEERVLLTLLYPGDPATRGVLVESAPNLYSFASMERFAGTSLWSASFIVPRNSRIVYHFVVRRVVPTTEGDSPGLRLTITKERDALNPARSSIAPLLATVVFPDTAAQPYIVNTGVPQGALVLREIKSSLLDETRPYTVYTPPGYDSRQRGACGLLLVFDGEYYGALDAPPEKRLIPTPAILDNLIAAQEIPPLIAVLLNGQETRNRDLACSPLFLQFLRDELLPAVRTEFVGAARRARRVIVAGSSFGGLFGAYCALTDSKTFGNVVSQSGSFWFYPEFNEVPNNGRDSLLPESTILALMRETKRQPVRFYLEVGRFESVHRMQWSNRAARDILRLKGYDVTYAEFPGSHDHECWRGSLADGLMAVTRDWERQ
ncbi:MAG: alpha/beta hydrolase-fold protein [Armatimonadota bacterium]